MIKVEIQRDHSDIIKSLKILGHAQYAGYGEDIVCAGVSALAETAVLGIEQVAGVKPCLTKKEGYFLLTLGNNVRSEQLNKVNIILETIYLGLKDMSESYPSHICTKEIKEVL